MHCSGWRTRLAHGQRPKLLNEPDGAISETKTLAMFTNQANAQRIMDAACCEAGDVLIFSKTVNKHGHSTIYLGGGKMAMHTYANHPNCPERGGGVWTGLMTAEHNLVDADPLGRRRHLRH